MAEEEKHAPQSAPRHSKDFVLTEDDLLYQAQGFAAGKPYFRHRTEESE
jgi:hypothetical protein